MPTACSDADLEDDDAMFEEYASSAASMQLARGGTMQDSSMSSAVVAFLEKRFGSVSHFYTDTTQAKAGINGFDRLESLRRALNALDRGGWERSYHQRVFHESFINAVVRVLFKTDPPGFFSQSYPRILELNTWTSIHQEILISTPRRFGKTISVCLFVAALVFACPRIEISIYSTCKRISSKLLRNCVQFLSIIHDVLKVPPMEFLKQARDEVEIKGPEGKYDIRKLNSYPSKTQSGSGKIMSMLAPKNVAGAAAPQTAAVFRGLQMQPPGYPPGAGYGPYAAGVGAYGYPPAPAGYPPSSSGYPASAAGYPASAAGYPPSAGGYPPSAGGYPPSAGGYPPSAGSCPPSAGSYPPTAGGYPPTAGPYASSPYSAPYSQPAPRPPPQGGCAHARPPYEGGYPHAYGR